ncbi:hypothetical protein ENSA7_22050 [Enhygromyxa salina]|uniref:Uncharacterized protein n=1 Tax=Enhygromyxa salina TaxID=215803 RepID=A0A2S9YSH4_9BACT|nr:hypothetical protein ENSA7_22050 [Enhygromyxa salina]
MYSISNGSSSHVSRRFEIWISPEFEMAASPCTQRRVSAGLDVPHAVLNLVDRTAQVLEFVRGDEAPQKVTRSGRVRCSDSAEHLQQRWVLLDERHVLETGAPGVEHQRLRHDVVRLVVGYVTPENLDALVEEFGDLEASELAAEIGSPDSKQPQARVKPRALLRLL